MNTKRVNKLSVNQNTFRKVAEKLAEVHMADSLSKLKMQFSSDLIKEIEELLKNDWVEFVGIASKYNKKIVALVPDFYRYKFGEGLHWKCSYSADYMKFDGFDGNAPTIEEFKKLYPQGTVSYIRANKKEYYYTKVIIDGTSHSINVNHHNTYLRDEDLCLYIPIYRLNGKNSKRLSTQATIKLWIENGLVPEGLSSKVKSQYEHMRYLIEKNYIVFDKNYHCSINVDLLQNIIEEMKRGSLRLRTNEITVDYQLFLDDKLAKQTFEVSKDLSKELYDDLKEDLLNCDLVRADIQSYPEKILVDPNGGHWELWDGESNSESSYHLNGDFDFIARNPTEDIKKNGVVGIDFGTKSTVVTYLDNNKTLPMRVGTGDLSKKISERHYENPTVMEFINLDKFLHDYEQKEGRPYTSWQDIVVSHTAASEMVNANSTEFNAFIHDLKQWAGDEKRIITILDKNGENRVLQPFHQLGKNDFNPIEIYAYYIGLYINNMWNGIYLDYMLSFPVTYDMDTRKKIADCFERGLKKSLPETVLKSREHISQFRINTDISEPAAYAVCALQEYGFDPDENEKVFYGIFDFGGGTTDFDFGLWRGANRKERRYDYVIEHFGAGGDKYLGGENLLELLAFETFKTNQDLLRENEIMFTLPPECKKFPGSEVLISENQEARLNTKQLMEKLRPLWEQTDEYESIYSLSSVKVKLFNSAGEYKDYDLVVRQEEIEGTIKKRIEKGVRNFFAALAQSFTIHSTEGVNQVNIFLAGNSCKSQYVKDLFTKYIEIESEKIAKAFKVELPEQEYFRVFPPLGSEESNNILAEKGILIDLDNMERPTGKTGVAFGLIKCRKGSKIKVVDSGKVSHGTQEEITFQYFIGYEKKEKFILLDDLKLAKSVYGKPDYHTWYNYIDAGIEDFELYYTKLPEAVNGQLEIGHVLLKRERIDVVDEDAFVYIRAVAPKILEYVVATEEGIVREEYLGQIKKIELE